MTNSGEPVSGTRRVSADRRGFGDLIDSAGVAGKVQHVAWDPHGSWMAATLQGTGLAIFPSDTGAGPILIGDGTAAANLGLAVSPDGSQLAWTYVGGQSPIPGGGHPLFGRVRVVDPLTGADMWSVSPGGLFPTFSPNSQLLVIRRHLVVCPVINW